MKTVYRKELKYVILKSEFLHIKKHLDALMIKDEHAGPFGYMVRSLYFDSIYDRDLYDKLDGVLEKRKIRIRIYDWKVKSGKLEYKCKNGTDGVKYSLSLTRGEIQDMLDHNYTFLMDRDEELAQRIYLRMSAGAYTPKTIIEYNRLAYKYPVSDTRVTFDTEVRASLTPFGLLEEDPGYIPIIPTDQGVLEIKYNNFFPGALKQVIQAIDRLQTANSKYAQGRLLHG